MAPQSGFKANEHTPEQIMAAKSQIAIIQQVTGIRLTNPERDKVIDDATSKRGTFLGPSKHMVMDRVSRDFAQALRARGDEKSVEFAARIERARQDKQGAAPKPVVEAPKVLDAQAERSIRSLAVSCNVDPDYLIHEVKTAQVRATKGPSGDASVAVTSSYINPKDPDQHMRSVANELAANILFTAYGSNKPFVSAKPNFSEDHIAEGAGRFMLINSTTEVRDKTTNRWLDSEAKILKVDRSVLESTLTTYATLSQGNPALAERYLSQCELNPKAMEFVRLAAPRMSTAKIGDGPTRFFVSLADTFAIKREEAKNDALRKVV